MSYKGFLEEIDKGLPAPGYLCAASDPFLLAEASSLIKELTPPEQREFNFHIFDMAETNPAGFDSILDVLNTMPFFFGRKFVLLENSQKLLKKDMDKLRNYLEKPSETSVLVLLNNGALKKELKGEFRNMKTIPLDITEREIHSWMKARAAAKGIKLSGSAIDYLLGTIGPDLGLLSSELDKCSLLGKQAIDKEDIAEIVEGRRSFSPFALVDAIRARDAALAFRIYRVLRETEEPYGLIGALNWQYAKAFPGKDTPQERDYFYRVFKTLNTADTDIKSSGGPYPMELLLVKLLRLSRGR